ncbi:MAG: PTS sugar transporter subunit IIC [Lachnospiraceae bacterium]|nr:PTS sugar transporter subunit IIC [Lachnospiraceae bacterium]
MKEFFNDKVIPKIMDFVNTKAMQALKNGLLYSMPMMMIGALFLLLNNFPFKPFTDMLAATGISSVLGQATDCTFSIIALIAAIGIGYTYVKNEGYNGLPAGVIALSVYLILQPSSVVGQDGGNIGVIMKTWTGGQGMIAAIASGLLVGWIYSIFMKKNITIKMPAGVPDGVANAFIALIPGAVIITGATIIYAVFKLTLGVTPIEWIYKVLQLPLQGLTDSFGGVVAMGFVIPFFWFFGIHGSTLIGDGIMGPLLLANSAANQAILDSGLPLTLANGGHIVTKQFLDQFMTVTGSGVTIGLVLYMFCLAKSKQLKEIGKLGIAPSLFNVNEPVLFGTPIVLNPMLAIPFMIMPILSGVIEYFAIYTGLCPMYGGVVVPWTCPPIISGFLVGGWRTALLQVVILVLSFFVYLPFIRATDKRYVKQEEEAQQ